jgi:hypothetical protein
MWGVTPGLLYLAAFLHFEVHGLHGAMETERYHANSNGICQFLPLYYLTTPRYVCIEINKKNPWFAM